jgi:hypothetical protein
VATFNVYYLLALITFAGTATYSGFSNHKLENKINTLEQTIQTYQKKENSIQPDTPKNNTPIKTIEHPSTVQNNTPNKATTTKAPTIKMLQPSGNSGLSDSSVKINDNPIQIDSPVKKPKIVKSIIIKKTSVIVKDTVVVKQVK